MPKHAFLSYNGDDWTCERGFQRAEDECQPIEVSEEAPPDLPEHAFVYYGDEWKCDRGFKRVDDRCEEIQVPEHAYLDFTGNDWICDRGFKREGNRCSPE